MLRHSFALAAALALGACGGRSADDLRSSIDDTTVVAEGNGVFESPTSVVSSRDGTTFYFAATSASNPELAGIYKVSSSGGDVTPIVVSALYTDLTLTLDCKGDTLYFVDSAYEPGQEGASPLYSVSVAGGEPTGYNVGATVLTGLAFDDRCENLYVSGTDLNGTTGVFRADLGAGGLELLATDFEPNGMYVDPDGVVWAVDGNAGTLSSINPRNGNRKVVLSGMSLPANPDCTLTSSGQDAIVPTLDENGLAGFAIIDRGSGKSASLTNLSGFEFNGIDTARDVPVIVMADQDANRIYRAE